MARGIAWLWLTLCLSTVAGAEENAVERAAALAEDLRFSEAARVLEGARAQPGLDRPTLLRILELQGVVAASIGRVDAARTAFRTLVVLEPGYALKGNYSPKVMAPYYEAKGWALEHGRMQFEATPARVEDGHLAAVGVRVPKDPMRLAARVRFHLLEEGVERAAEVPLAEHEAHALVKGEPVLWWAELLGERGEVLEQVGSTENPVVETARPEVKPTGPVARWVPQTPSNAAASPFAFPKLESRQWTAVGLAGGAVLATVGGVYFGVQSRQARAQIQQATPNAQGQVVGLTQRDAFALDAEARRDAVVADVLFVAAGALVTTGAVMWFNAGPAKVAVVPGGRGLLVSGVLP